MSSHLLLLWWQRGDGGSRCRDSWPTLFINALSCFRPNSLPRRLVGRHSTIETNFQATSGLPLDEAVCCMPQKLFVVPAAINVNNRVTFLPTTQIVGQQIMFVDTLIQVIMYIYINHFQTMYCKEIFLMMLSFCPLILCVAFFNSSRKDLWVKSILHELFNFLFLLQTGCK